MEISHSFIESVSARYFIYTTILFTIVNHIILKHNPYSHARTDRISRTILLERVDLCRTSMIKS